MNKYQLTCETQDSFLVVMVETKNRDFVWQLYFQTRSLHKLLRGFSNPLDLLRPPTIEFYRLALA